MVLTLRAPRFDLVPRAARWLPNLVSWLALAAMLWLLGWSYFSNPKPGPYGVCYGNHGRALVGGPCNSHK